MCIRDSACVALTVIRSVGWLSREDLATRKGNAGPSLETPGAQCLGEYEFRFAFAPRATPPSEALLCELGRHFLAPPRTVVGTGNDAAAGSLAYRQSFLRVEGDGTGRATLSALKKADERDSVVARFFNASPRAVDLKIQAPEGTGGARRTNLREQKTEALRLDSGVLTMSLGPRKIATVEFEK